MFCKTVKAADDVTNTNKENTDERVLLPKSGLMKMKLYFSRFQGHKVNYAHHAPHSDLISNTICC